MIYYLITIMSLPYPLNFIFLEKHYLISLLCHPPFHTYQTTFGLHVKAYLFSCSVSHESVEKITCNLFLFFSLAVTDDSDDFQCLRQHQN